MEDKRDGGLLEALEAYAASDFYPCHMPGHKRNPAAFGERASALAAAARLDITEIEGFDNLHEPEGLLKEAMERAARLYGADQTFYSVNGSTAGLLTAIAAAMPEGGKLIMARNCHKAAYHAVYLRKLKPVYLYPETVPGAGLADAPSRRQVEDALALHPDAGAVLLTSPTYDGIAADVEGIAQAVHRYGVPLIVDSAHGAHFGFHPAFPDSPVHLGADLTVMSLHKTMPCMTQTALLHVCGERVSRKRLQMFEKIFQTSSPSYFLMAGMDQCIRLTQEKGAALWDSFLKQREDFLNRTAQLKTLRIITAGCNDEGIRRMDPGKILIESAKTGLTGKQLYDVLLNRYHLQMEMAAGNYVTAIMTCCDTKEGWERLADALCGIDAACAGARQPGRETEGAGRASQEPAQAAESPVQTEQQPVRETEQPYPRLEAACGLSQALDALTRAVPLSEAEGRISGVFVNLYPPGIPIVVPGERISREAAALLTGYRRQGLPLSGLRGDEIEVLL